VGVSLFSKLSARLREAASHARAPRPSVAGVGVLGVAAVATALGAVSCAGPDEPAGDTVQAQAVAGAGVESAAPRPGCRVEYRTRVDTGGQFIVDVTVANTGSAALSQWALAFDYGGDQKILSADGARSTQDGGAVRLEATTPLAAGGTATVSLVGSYAAGNPMPSGFQLAGQKCTEQVVGAAAPPPTVAGGGGPAGGPAGPAAGPGAGPGAGGPAAGGSKEDKSNSGPGKGKKKDDEGEDDD
jgi:hypothetical protein